VIDLHLHTTASDGRSAPEALVAAARDAGITVLAVTDHDTTAACAVVAAATRDAGLQAIAGIEITAVDEARDVHVLGYFLDPDHAELREFLVAQRADRHRRLTEILARLQRMGIQVELPQLEDDAAAPSSRSLGRPLVARALVQAGHARDIADAFERYLGEGRPGFVPRAGAPSRAVIELIRRAGGIASIAHPGKLGRDDLVRQLIDDGLPAVEAYHPDHTEADTMRYLQLAADAGLLVTGGSDYHGPGSGRIEALGQVGLPAVHFERLAELAERS
jgi:predicted metal-dependent phosphoesterase TrpH